MAEGGDSLHSEGSVVTKECLEELLDFFFKNAYRAKNLDRRVSLLTICLGTLPWEVSILFEYAKGSCSLILQNYNGGPFATARGTACSGAEISIILYAVKLQSHQINYTCKTWLVYYHSWSLIFD